MNNWVSGWRDCFIVSGWVSCDTMTQLSLCVLVGVFSGTCVSGKIALCLFLCQLDTYLSF